LALGFLKESTVGRSFFTKKNPGGQIEKGYHFTFPKMLNPKLYQTHFWTHLQFGPFWLTLQALPKKEVKKSTSFLHWILQ